MAIADSYASIPEYKAAKGFTSAADDLAIHRDLLAVSRMLDRKLGVYSFNKDAAVTTRIYGPRDPITEIASTTGLIIKLSSGYPVTWGDLTAMTIDTDFELRPFNALAEGKPYTDIFFTWSNYWPSVIHPQTYRPTDYRVQVTAIHGWPTVPEAIKTATIELTAMLRGESPYSTNRYTEVNEMVGQSLDARRLLGSLSGVYARFPVGIG